MRLISTRVTCVASVAGTWSLLLVIGVLQALFGEVLGEFSGPLPRLTCFALYCQGWMFRFLPCMLGTAALLLLEIRPVRTEVRSFVHTMYLLLWALLAVLVAWGFVLPFHLQHRVRP